MIRHWSTALVRLEACPEAVAWAKTQPDYQTERAAAVDAAGAAEWDAAQRRMAQTIRKRVPVAPALKVTP